MKTLFIGGTGIISAACVKLAVAKGHEVAVLNRGRRFEIEGAEQIVCDVNDPSAAQQGLRGRRWDAVVDFVCFEPSQMAQRMDLLAGRTSHYVFISSASAYQRPVRDFRVTESTPLDNPFWSYSRNKIACEEALMKAVRERRFPASIVRPSLTFGDTVIPLAINSWEKSYTVVDRMRKGKPVIVPGDGTSLWTITHNTDFAKGLVGLLGNDSAIGHAFHITSDEVLTWDQIYRATARAAGVDEPKLVHIASDFLIACLPEMEGTLLGDKVTSVVMDNSKIKRFVPDFMATTRFEQGIRQTIAAFDADPAKREIDEAANETYDRLVELYSAGLAAAKAAFGR
ncbi:SDR family oxidoreductase [Pelagicoccus sp. SDUM812003]|uniref:SDR family oxidoreductase n=1 Tax=Pelagicoccus sp. SDUM812003 TaxID=3041267 RepID=UPI0028109B11|nr:SDR family oxidoreductase [Pelagicoccus sp. SDUM812003]MDQ8203242.1 SDR family oxidoreductase [Pelagicoccus sp. SDUM812003]